ncbi:MAG: hypothetical protein QM530_08315 [Phycisphaerales bacterium]|nr:hypothetical protein [Phycisphaerales bacterium]
MKKVLLFAMILIAVNTEISMAQKVEVITSNKLGWHQIGKTTVDFKSDRDVIMILGYNRFSSIKFKVSEAPIELLDLEVYYEMGEKDDIKIQSSIKSNGESRIIDLNGSRKVTKVIFIYKTLKNRNDKKAKVELWGLNAPEEKL